MKCRTFSKRCCSVVMYNVNPEGKGVGSGEEV